VVHPDLRDFARWSPLSPELEDRLHAEVCPDEKVYWVGRPSVSRLVVVFAIPFVLLGLGCFALVVFITTFVWTFPPPVAPGREWGRMIVSVFFLLPFCCTGLLLIGTPIWAFVEARRTLYAVTDRRLILSRPIFNGSIRTKSFLTDDVGPLERLERADGSGDLLFGLAREFRRKDGTNALGRQGFFGIAQVREVESLIRATLLADGWAGRPAGMRVSRTISGGQP